MDFILGTAQIGQPYGVVNHTGAIDRDQAAELINFAWKQGIRTIDTAIDYGQSQNILGQVLPHDARIITKLKADPNQHLQAQVELALKTLKRSRVYGVLIHNPESLKDTRIWQRMLELKESGLAEKIGISVYDPDEYLLHSTERNIDILQFPCNLFD